MFNYAQLNKDDYCIGIASLNSEILLSDMILIESYDPSYIGRRFDRVKRVWSNDYYPVLPEPTYVTKEDLQKDILLSMELEADTNEKVVETGDDSLLLMELLISIDEKLTQLLQPK